ncbi:MULTISPECIES: acetate/propionate family kinase [Flammeovirga]|uniref:acetate/propionate family kinase n=1 Tax=Flammeovirga TaxID=59739 RepID=UPI0008249754|nr:MULTISPECIES: acetate kinase [Flammeovirga]ANQ48745.2 acetate kinase [Flammeovirga sp. MY04]MBB3698823.1 acetate kinase [Flammeovirga yaeyamensis]NMF37408.1 acetate kinase [Flammeovirga yaeyamensis]
MKILILNSGSSSIKFQLIDMPSEEVIGKGLIEKIGLTDASITVKNAKGKKETLQLNIPNHAKGIEFLLSVLTDKEMEIISDLDELTCVGHRIVHGGQAFSKSVLINDDVMHGIESCIELAPLHNPANIKGVQAMDLAIPGIPQVGVFDTAFHHSIPEHRAIYALPIELYKKYGLRKYGFHGTSHQYVSLRAKEIYGDDKTSKIITCHLGNGGSLAAIQNGKSIETSMGFSPTDGLMMGTRCGSIDPGAIPFIAEHENLDLNGISNLINKKSGLQGISGVSSDYRDVSNAAAKGNEDAKLALQMFHYDVKKYIGTYLASLGGVETIIFTGGIGENSAMARREILRGLEGLGIKVDDEKNDKVMGIEADISPDDAGVRVCVIPTNEEVMIARDTFNIVSELN